MSEKKSMTRKPGPLRSQILAALLATSMLTGCAAFDNTNVAELVEAPEAYAYDGQTEAEALTDDLWVQSFAAPALEALVKESLDNNFDIEAGLATLRSADAALRASQSSLFPSLNLGASATASSEDDYDEFNKTGRLSASYQLDLFGSNRASASASRASLVARRFDQRTLEISVRADVISSYISVLALRDQLASARANLEIAERIYELVIDRYEAGAVSGFDKESQRASLAVSQARLPQLEQQLIAAETALAILIGRAPQGFAAPEGDLDLMTVPLVKAGLPSDLLLRRPDLRAAEARLKAADANITVARAAMFPSIDLSAGFNSVLTPGADILGSVANSIAIPIFSGGRLKAQTDRAKAERDALVSNYQKAVMNAFRDVDLALRAATVAASREESYRTASQSFDHALELAEIRYRSGADDLTSLLNAQSNALSARDNFTAARQARFQAAIDLYVAIGGGWKLEEVNVPKEEPAD